jgi:TfoX/Sxy family transcriptional regulator of competence genes
MTAAVSADERFASLSKALNRHAGVTTGWMFGSEGLKVADKVFALLVKGRLVVKLPETRVGTLIDEGAGAHFDPGHGRLMREWIAIEPQADVDWLALAKEAKRYVGSGR